MSRVPIFKNIFLKRLICLLLKLMFFFLRLIDHILFIIFLKTKYLVGLLNLELIRRGTLFQLPKKNKAFFTLQLTLLTSTFSTMSVKVRGGGADVCTKIRCFLRLPQVPQKLLNTINQLILFYILRLINLVVRDFKICLFKVGA